MCQRIRCTNCGKPGWAGCGAHVELILADVPPDPAGPRAAPAAPPAAAPPPPRPRGPPRPAVPVPAAEVPAGAPARPLKPTGPHSVASEALDRPPGVLAHRRVRV